MRSINILFCLLLVTIMSCKSSKFTATAVQKETLKDIITKPEFRIESDWAYPQVTYAVQQVLNSGLLAPGNNANAINLIGNTNFLTISKDSVSSYLPYYGERMLQVGYGGRDAAITFKGLVENYKQVQNKDDSYSITFKAKSNSEIFNVMVRLFPNLTTDITLNSISRRTIRYTGRVKRL